MTPFITGSHAYGTPAEYSDIDLVIPPMKESEVELLRTASSAGIIKYDKLNLIVAPTEEAFHLWEECNNELKAQKPVTRKFAIEFIESKFKNTGIERFLDNSGPD